MKYDLKKILCCFMTKSCVLIAFSFFGGWGGLMLFFFTVGMEG